MSELKQRLAARNATPADMNRQKQIAQSDTRSSVTGNTDPLTQLLDQMLGITNGNNVNDVQPQQPQQQANMQPIQAANTPVGDYLDKLMGNVVVTQGNSNAGQSNTQTNSQAAPIETIDGTVKETAVPTEAVRGTSGSNSGKTEQSNTTKTNTAKDSQEVDTPTRRPVLTDEKAKGIDVEKDEISNTLDNLINSAIGRDEYEAKQKQNIKSDSTVQAVQDVPYNEVTLPPNPISGLEKMIEETLSSPTPIEPMVEQVQAPQGMQNDVGSIVQELKALGISREEVITHLRQKGVDEIFLMEVLEAF